MKTDEFSELKWPTPAESARILGLAREMRAKYLADLGQRGVAAAGRLVTGPWRRFVPSPRRALSG